MTTNIIIKQIGIVRSVVSILLSDLSANQQNYGRYTSPAAREATGATCSTMHSHNECTCALGTSKNTQNDNKIHFGRLGLLFWRRKRDRTTVCSIGLIQQEDSLVRHYFGVHLCCFRIDCHTYHPSPHVVGGQMQDRCDMMRSSSPAMGKRSCKVFLGYFFSTTNCSGTQQHTPPSPQPTWPYEYKPEYKGNCH